MEGAGLQPKTLPRPVVKHTTFAPPATCPVAATGSKPSTRFVLPALAIAPSDFSMMVVSPPALLPGDGLALISAPCLCVYAGVPPRSDLWTSDAGVEEPVDRPACVRQGRQEQRRSGSGGALAAPSTSHRQPFFAIEPLRPAAPGRAGPCRPEPACKRSRMCVSRLMMSIVSGRRKSLGSGWALSDVNL